MSMVRCTDCSRLIDSDDHPECFVEETDKILCEGCLEEYESERMGYAYADYLADKGDAEAKEERIHGEGA